MSIIGFNSEVLILLFTASTVILKTLMAEISLAFLKKERRSVMIIFLLITSVAASCFIVARIPSTGLFPCEDAKKKKKKKKKKSHVISILHLFYNQDKVGAMHRSLNWLLEPSNHMHNAVMFSLSSCLKRCSRNTITQSLEWLQSSDTTTAEVQSTLCQRAAVKTVIWFLYELADWTSTCQRVE